jgi:hypothetical protein
MTVTNEKPPRAPEISAYEDNLSRIERLQLTWNAIASASTLLVGREKALFPKAILKLHDHKGVLEVLWRDALGLLLFKHLTIDAWSQQGEWEVQHEVA